MKFRMDKIIRELVEESWEWARLGRTRDFVDRDRVFSETLIELESEGDAMRYVDSKGRIAWKATPDLRDYLNDLKLDAEADLEDQEDDRQIIRDMLAATDYEITEAEDGEQALAAIAKQRPDLILMDIQMPIMDGYAATRLIKADPALRLIPIIAVTSYALSGEEKKARAAGCDDYVPKPSAPVNSWRKSVSTCPNRPHIDCCGA